MRLCGRDYRGVAEAFVGTAAVAEGGLLTLLRRVPRYRAHWRVALDADSNPTDPRALAHVAERTAVVRITALR